MKNNLKLSEVQTHYGVIEICYEKICSIFEECDALTPSISELAMGTNGSFKYAKVLDKKLKNKVGFVVDLNYEDFGASVSISVNNFKTGKASFNSNSTILKYIAEVKKDKNNIKKFNDDLKQERIKNRFNRIKQAQEQIIKQEKEEAELKSRFDYYHNEYSKGSVKGLERHPYNKSKAITCFGDMRIISKNCTCNPFRKPNSTEIVGFQIIAENGFKKSVTKYKGAMVGAYMYVSGDLNARNIFIGEGFASADKVSKLKNNLHKKSLVVACISANNFPKLVKEFKIYREHNKIPCVFNIAPDNDHIKEKAGKGNAGLRFGMEALFISGKDTKLYIPDFEPHVDGSDWDDLWRADKVKAKSMFKSKTISLYEASIIRLKSFPLQTSEGQLKKAVSKCCSYGLGLFPLTKSRENIIDDIFNAYSHIKSDKKIITSIFDHFSKSYIKKANSAISVGEPIDNVDYYKVDNINHAKDMIDSLKNVTHKKGAVVLLKAPMGSGKTQVVLKDCMSESQESNKFPIAIAPVKSLVLACAKTFDVSHYMLDRDDDFEITGASHRSVATGLAVTINSLPLDKFKTFSARSSIVVADEISQILRSITHGTVKDDMKAITERSLANLLNKTELAVLADADLNHNVINYVRKVTHEDVLVVVIEVEEKLKSDVNYYLKSSTDSEVNHAENLMDLLEFLDGGKNIYCCSDSKEKTDVILEAVSKTIESKDVLLINSDTIGYDDSVEFLENPNKYIEKKQPRLIIASPCVQSGISIEKEHFHLGFAFCTGTVTPTYISQMLHRVRYLKDFYISLICPTPKSDVNLESEKYLFLSSINHYMKENMIDSSLRQSNDHIVYKDQFTVTLHDSIINYCQLKCSLQALDTSQRYNFSNFFALQAMYKGINVFLNDSNLPDPDKKDLKKLSKVFKDNVAKAKNEALVGENKMSKDEFENLSKSNFIPQKLQNEFKRCEIALALGKNEIDLDDIDFYNKKGKKYLLSLMTFNKGHEIAIEDDKNDLNSGIAIIDEKRRVSLVRLCNTICKTLKIDENYFVGDFSKIEAGQLLDNILADESLTTYIRLNLGMKLNDKLSPIHFAKSLLKTLFGFKTERAYRSTENHRLQFYKICRKEVIQLKNYAENINKIIGEKEEILVKKAS